MSLSPGTKLGPYEIQVLLGAGGMGEVYRARDTRLERTVAIKILPEHLWEKPEAKDRFDREARAISSLSHANICQLYDVGSQNGISYLVMEFLEGETLAERLRKSPLPLAQALRVGIDICEGLEETHRRGILHRDLKPGNIMLTKSGAKLMDFGLAKAAVAAMTARSPLTEVATMSQQLTAERTIVGTPQYMSPEQVEGKPVDARSDIFSLGAILYEMVTGKQAFEGITTARVIASILTAEPKPISRIQPMSPPALQRVVRTCLAKDPDERLQAAHDVKLQLKWIGENRELEADVPVRARRIVSRSVLWSIAAMAVLAALAFAAALLHRPSPAARVVRSSLLPPAGWSFKSYNLAVSPDGTRVAFIATGSEGENALWVRTLSAGNAQQINGTEGAIYPFWSPDSRHIGFFAQGKLKIVDIAGSAVQILCDARQGRGGTWNRKGEIVFAPNIVGPLYRISTSGGVPLPITKLPRAGSGQAHRWPSFLPDDQHFLYFADWSSPEDPQQNGIYIGSLDGGASKLLSSELAGNVVFASGYLLYVRDRSLLAQAFDPNRLTTTGPAMAVADQEITTDVGFSQSGFSVSQNGVLVFQSVADSTSHLAWFDASGKELAPIPGFGYGEPRISPDGRFLAFDSDDDRNGKSFIRVYDFARGISTRLTDGGNEMTPAWTPDGKRITYVTGVRAASSIYQVPADLSGPPQLLLKGAKMMHEDWSPDGHLVFAELARGLPEVEVYSAADHQISKFAPTGAETRFSPNGKWIAYAGVFVQPFPGPGGRMQIGVGSQPVWSRDGRQLYYIAPDKTMMAVSFDPATGRAGAPRALFKTRIIAPNFVGTQYDVAPDGRFVINVLPADHSSPLTLLQNWTGLLKQH